MISASQQWDGGERPCESSSSNKARGRQHQQWGMYEQQWGKGSRVVATMAAVGGGEWATTGVCLRKWAMHMGGSSSTGGDGHPVERGKHHE